MFFNRDPLERVWIKLEKYERALGAISSIKPRLAKRITGSLRNSLQEELDRRRSRGNCSAYGLIDVSHGFDDAISFIFGPESRSVYSSTAEGMPKSCIRGRRPDPSLPETLPCPGPR